MSQIRRVVDDLLPVLREGHSLILRSTVAPGHHRLGGRLHRAAARLPRRREPVRVARAGADRREPLPRGDRHAALHRRRRGRGIGCQGGRAVRASSAPRSFRPARSEAELAKIWTNILRYTQFALPNLLMMEAEQYGANVFEVIDLINHDYPRGGMGRPGPDRRRLPAQGLHLLRGALELARHAAGRLARARDRAAVPGQGAQGAARRIAARPQGRRARAELQARLRRHARLALLQADPPARARAGPRGAPRPARVRRVRALRGGGRGRRRRGRSRPITPSSRACSTGFPRARCWWTRGT